MSKLRVLPWWGLVAIVACGCDDSADSETQVTPPRPVSVMVLRPSDPARLDRVAGSVEAWKAEAIGFEVAGRVDYVVEPDTDVSGKVYNASGDLLTTPTVLARLDPTRYQLAVKSVESDIEANRQQEEALKIEIDEVFPAQKRAAEAERDLARTEVERNQKLVAENAAPERALDLTRSKLDSAEAKLSQIDAEREAERAQLASLVAKREQLKQSLAEAQRDEADCTLYSPYSGQAAEVHVIPGGYVERGEPVVTVQLMDPIAIEFEVARDTLRRLNFRDMLSVFIPRADGSLMQRQATVYLTDPVADAATRTFTVTLLSQNEKVALEIPPDLRDQPVVQTTNVWRLASREINGEPVYFVDEKSFQSDAEGEFLWKITNRSVGTLSAESSPQLEVVKVRVGRGERLIDFLGLYKFQEVAIVEGEEFNVATDLVTGEVIYPDGLDAANWQGNLILFRQARWLLRPGDLVGVALSGRPAEPGLYVPLDAILEQSGTTSVFVVDDSGDRPRARRIPVRSGETIGTLRRIESLEEGALVPGETRIVVDGALFLRDGEEINVSREVEVDR